MNFDQAFVRLLGHEGGYSDNPADPGGETMWGVTQRVARANGYQGPMINLPRDVAAAIYRRQYWDAVKSDMLPEAVRFDVFDAAVNSGTVQAVKWLQRAAGTNADGVIGPMTLQAAARTADGLVARFNGHRLQFMADLPAWTTFGRGWARRIASNLIG